MLVVACLLDVPANRGRVCSHNVACCHTDTEVGDQTFYFIHSQYTGTGPTGPNADPITKGAYQGSCWSTNVPSQWYDSTWNKIHGSCWNTNVQVNGMTRLGTRSTAAAGAPMFQVNGMTRPGTRSTAAAGAPMFQVNGMTRLGTRSTAKVGIKPRSGGGRLTSRPTRRS